MKQMKLGKWIAATILAGAVCIPQLVAAERTGSHSVRASTLKGATITFQEGGAAGRVEDIILDPETGCARFAVIQLEGGRTVAAPYRVLHSSGPSGYVVAVTRDQLLNAPAVDLNRVEEFSAPEFSQRVYGYYRMGPEGEVNVRGVQGKIRVEGEQGRESEAQRTKHGQEQVAPGAAESRRSPAPLGERTKKKNHGQASVTPSPSASVTPAAMPSASPSTTVIPTPTVSPNAPAREEATPAVKETPATTPAGSRTQTPTAPKVTPGAQ